MDPDKEETVLLNKSQQDNEVVEVTKSDTLGLSFKRKMTIMNPQLSSGHFSSSEIHSSHSYREDDDIELV